MNTEPKDFTICGCIGYDILDATGVLVGMEWHYCPEHKQIALNTPPLKAKE